LAAKSDAAPSMVLVTDDKAVLLLTRV
jgi:hypothetical protein